MLSLASSLRAGFNLLGSRLASSPASGFAHPRRVGGAAAPNDEIYGGWPMILSGLKTWLETGELLTRVAR